LPSSQWIILVEFHGISYLCHSEALFGLVINGLVINLFLTNDTVNSHEGFLKMALVFRVISLWTTPIGPIVQYLLYGMTEATIMIYCK